MDKQLSPQFSQVAYTALLLHKIAIPITTVNVYQALKTVFPKSQLDRFEVNHFFGQLHFLTRLFKGNLCTTTARMRMTVKNRRTARTTLLKLKASSEKDFIQKMALSIQQRMTIPGQIAKDKSLVLMDYNDVHPDRYEKPEEIQVVWRNRKRKQSPRHENRSVNSAFSPDKVQQTIPPTQRDHLNSPKEEEKSLIYIRPNFCSPTEGLIKSPTDQVTQQTTLPSGAYRKKRRQEKKREKIQPTSLTSLQATTSAYSFFSPTSATTASTTRTADTNSRETNTLQQRSHSQGVETCDNEVLAIAARKKNTLLHWGTFFREQGKFKNALAFYEDALNLDPDDNDTALAIKMIKKEVKALQ